MNKIIEAGDTLGAVVKLAAGGVVLYGLWRVYRISQDASEKAAQVSQTIDDATQGATEFFTGTINPVSNKNFIYQSSVGQAAKGVLFNVFDYFGVGKP